MRVRITPVAKPRMTQRDRWKQRKRVILYRRYCDRLRLFKLPVDWEHLQIRFELPMPPSWSEKMKKLMEGTPHRNRPDIDNLLKGFMDALLTEDSAVYSVTAEKYWGRNGYIDVVLKT